MIFQSLFFIKILLYFNKNYHFAIHFLFNAKKMDIVKVHRVFPSHHNYLRIFTQNSISPSQFWRQWGSRNSIHAGQ